MDQEIRRFELSTVPRVFPVTAGCDRTWVIALSTAPWSTHPPNTSAAPQSPLTNRPSGSRTCNYRRAHRRPQSGDPCDFALVAMLGLLSLRIFEATAAEITDLGEEHATGRCACAAKAPRSSWSRYRPVLPM